MPSALCVASLLFQSTSKHNTLLSVRKWFKGGNLERIKNWCQNIAFNFSQARGDGLVVEGAALWDAVLTDGQDVELDLARGQGVGAAVRGSASDLRVADVALEGQRDAEHSVAGVALVADWLDVGNVVVVVRRADSDKEQRGVAAGKVAVIIVDLDSEGKALSLGDDGDWGGLIADEIASGQQQIVGNRFDVGHILDAAGGAALANVSLESFRVGDLQHNAGKRFVTVALLTLDAANVTSVLGEAGADLLVVLVKLIELVELVAAAVALSLLASAGHL